MATLHEPPMFKDMSQAPDQPAVLAQLRPEHTSSSAISDHDKAVEFITDFAGRYATTPTVRKYLQCAIDAAQPVNCAIAPSERGAVIASYTYCFKTLLDHDSSLNAEQRTERMGQLQQSLAVLEDRFDLPAASAQLNR